MDGRKITTRLIIPGKDNRYYRTDDTAIVGGFKSDAGTHPFVFTKTELSGKHSILRALSRSDNLHFDRRRLDDNDLLAWSEVDQKVGEIRIEIQGICNITGRNPRPLTPAERSKKKKEAKAQQRKAVPNMGGDIHEKVKNHHHGYRIGYDTY